MEPETEYHYVKGVGWVPGTERSITVINFNKTLNVTLIDRTPQPGEYGQWCLDDDHYAENGVIDLNKLALWARNCVCYARDGTLIGARVITDGGIEAENPHTGDGGRAIWFTIQVHEV